MCFGMCFLHRDAWGIPCLLPDPQLVCISFCCFQVYLLGDVGVEEELDLKGIAHLGGPGDGDHKVELKPGYAMPHDPEVTHTRTTTMMRQRKEAYGS